MVVGFERHRRHIHTVFELGPKRQSSGLLQQATIHVRLVLFAHFPGYFDFIRGFFHQKLLDGRETMFDLLGFEVNSG